MLQTVARIAHLIPHRLKDSLSGTFCYQHFLWNSVVWLFPSRQLSFYGVYLQAGTCIRVWIKYNQQFCAVLIKMWKNKFTISVAHYICRISLKLMIICIESSPKRSAEWCTHIVYSYTVCTSITIIVHAVYRHASQWTEGVIKSQDNSIITCMYYSFNN